MEQKSIIPKYLVIVLHGYTCKTSLYTPLKKVIESTYSGAKVLIPKLPMQAFSTINPNTIVQTVLELIDREWKEVMDSKGTEDALPNIIIIGHSTGALLARKLYICACGENPDAPFEKVYTSKSTKPWAKQVDRVILFAGVNRGWTVNQYIYQKLAFLIRFGIVIGNLLTLFGVRPLIYNIKRGASFITQLRIQWLSMLRNDKGRVGKAMVIQLLGTIDDLISPDDNIDLVTGKNFIYLDVPLSGHVNVLDMDDKIAGQKRKDVFVKALTYSQKELEKIQIIPADQFVNETDDKVTDVVFVVHGIRDTGFWTQKVARRVKAIGDSAKRKFAMETSTYGYFPMLPFLLFSRRRAKVEWLMDQYTENLAHYPNAQFSFVGHSNGTYLLAKALKEYPACRFKNVLFAGSVVQQSYDWNELLSTNRISKFYNVVATSDWVVACFPKSFQRLRFQDLGSAGFDGFSMLNDTSQFKYVQGSHGAAIEEKYWDEIANFIVSGEFPESESKFKYHPRSPFMTFLGAIAPIPLFAALFLALAPAYYIWMGVENLTYRIAWVAIYLFSIWKVITRF